MSYDRSMGGMGKFFVAMANYRTQLATKRAADNDRKWQDYRKAVERNAALSKKYRAQEKASYQKTMTQYSTTVNKRFATEQKKFKQQAAANIKRLNKLKVGANVKNIEAKKRGKASRAAFVRSEIGMGGGVTGTSRARSNVSFTRSRPRRSAPVFSTRSGGTSRRRSGGSRRRPM